MIWFIYFGAAFGFAEHMHMKHGYGGWRSVWEGIGWPWWLGNLLCHFYFEKIKKDA